MEYKERQKIAKRKYRNSIHGKEIRKKYRGSGKGKEIDKRWRSSKEGKEYMKKYLKSYHKTHPYYDNVGWSTRNKYGSLIKGYNYNHWKPYNKDNFVILEAKFHRWYHSNIRQLIENKKTYGTYQKPIGNKLIGNYI